MILYTFCLNTQNPEAENDFFTFWYPQKVTAFLNHTTQPSKSLTFRSAVGIWQRMAMALLHSTYSSFCYFYYFCFHMLGSPEITKSSCYNLLSSCYPEWKIKQSKCLKSKLSWLKIKLCLTVALPLWYHRAALNQAAWEVLARDSPYSSEVPLGWVTALFTAFRYAPSLELRRGWRSIREKESI